MKANFKSAVHLVLLDDNKILIQKRKGSKLWPGFYALPAGHIDEGENQYEALVREAKEELNIVLEPKDILKEYVVLRRNHFKIDGKLLEPYIDYYFEITKYTGIPEILEKDKCEELIWCNINDLPEPFINYEGDFLENKKMKNYDCLEDGAYVENIKNLSLYGFFVYKKLIYLIKNINKMSNYIRGVIL